MRDSLKRKWIGLLTLFWGFPVCVWAGLRIQPLQPPQLGNVLEFRIDGLPSVHNPFDPEQIRVDGRFIDPSGHVWIQPAFWYQDYQSKLVRGQERLDPIGKPHWRLRFTPLQPGRYTLQVQVSLPNHPQQKSSILSFSVSPSSRPKVHFVRIRPGSLFLQTVDGQPLPLIGHCLCWHHRRGTYDYRDWFHAMAQAGENFARLWMWPWAFGLETEPGTLNHYRLDRAWQLDRVFRMAAAHGIYLLLCLDYHGMFQTRPDYWGGNNLWPKNPYNTSQGGPCQTPDQFFTNPKAQQLYRKRLRYLIARYGPFPNLLAWQFFNEIDNVYRNLNPKHVASWHQQNAAWLKQHDPWHHLVTTSLTGGSIRPEIWRLPELDFTVYHSYNLSDPAVKLPQIIQSIHHQFRKPVLVGEYGTDWRGWRREQDPHLRGWRQGLWAAALGGSMGTAMSWWWEQIHQQNLYPYYAALHKILSQTGWGAPDWKPIRFPSTSSSSNSASSSQASASASTPIVCGLHRDGEALLYVVNPNISYPRNARLAQPPLLTNAVVVIPNAKAGRWRVTWFAPTSGRVHSTQKVVSHDPSLRLSIPPFREDWVGWLVFSANE